jgi:hypothetical protein
MAVLKSVVAIPAVGEVDLLARLSVPREPSSADPTPHETPAVTEVESPAERCLDHRLSW